MADARAPIIACNLGALSPDERDRRSALAQALVASADSVAELADGYGLQLRASPSVARAALDWLLLERRCCSFLRLELELEPDGGSLWVRLRGGAGVKEFLAAAGMSARDAGSGHCC